MTTPSHSQASGFTILVYKPSIGAVTYTPAGTLVGEFSREVEQYQHTIAALGGYDSASFSINDRQEKLEDWLDRVGYHVEVYNPDLILIWEGFIDSVALNLGPLAITRGELTDIGNRVQCIYSAVDTTTTPPTMGMRIKTAVADNATSQLRYGIIEKLLSVGGATQEIGRAHV